VELPQELYLGIIHDRKVKTRKKLSRRKYADDAKDKAEEILETFSQNTKPEKGVKTLLLKENQN
jgi:hypothetical protein